MRLTADQCAELADAIRRTPCNVFEVAAGIAGGPVPDAFADALAAGVFRCWRCGWWLPHDDAADVDRKPLWYCHGCAGARKHE